MSIWDALGVTAGAAIADPIKEAGNAIDKVFTSDDERLAWMHKYDEIQKELALGQQEVNKIESVNSNLFMSGWRPALGWACAISVSIGFISQAIVANYVWITMCFQTHQLLDYPAPHALIELTAGILGIYGTQRTIEKIKGV